MNKTFDSKTHTYALDGNPVPSVTQILSSIQGYNYVDPECLKYRADIGTKAHRACELFDRGTLNEETLHPLLAGYLAGWKKFKSTTGYVIEQSELWDISTLYRFGGRIDNIGILNNKRTIIDIKTGCQSISHAIQMAGYSLLWEAERGEVVEQRVCVYLSEGGDFKVKQHVSLLDRSRFLELLRGYLIYGE